MIIDDVAGFLGRVPAFRLLSAEELRDLAEHVQVDFYTAGTAILTEGGPPSEFLRIVVSGGAKVTLPSGGAAEDEFEVDYRSEGAAIGYLSVFTGDRSRVNVLAAEDTVCYLIPWGRFHALLDRHPEVREFFTKTFMTTYLDKAFGDLRADRLAEGEGER